MRQQVFEELLGWRAQLAGTIAVAVRRSALASVASTVSRTSWLARSLSLRLAVGAIWTGRRSSHQYRSPAVVSQFNAAAQDGNSGFRCRRGHRVHHAGPSIRLSQVPRASAHRRRPWRR